MTSRALFNIHDLADRLDQSAPAAQEFFRAARLSMTIVSWPARSTDDQPPHVEDEVYYVAAGRAMLRIGEDDHRVGPGSIAYVAARVPHHFHTIEEDLRVLVFWSPPRRSGA